MTFLTLLPIAAILLCLIVFKFSVVKSGTIALTTALVIAVGFFGITGLGLLTASGKALWLSLFVSLIVWNAMLLYHLVSGFGAIEVINRNLTLLLKDRFVAFLLLGWLFTGLLQGIAGFGIPAVIVAPILISLGFPPLKALMAAILGHSWAVTFGSMGAAFYVMHGITDIPVEELGYPMWMFNMVTILCNGLGVCFIYDGFKGIKRGISYVLPTALVMFAVQFFTMRFGMYSLGTINTALAGVTTMFLLYKLRNKSGEKLVMYKSELNLLQSVLPYALILVLLLSFQLIPAEIRNNAALAPSFPETQTSLAEPHIAAAETKYNPLRLFVHPALVLVIAAIVACGIYKKAGIWKKEVFNTAVKQTIKKGIPATLALLAFGHMSLIMMDSGMMLMLAESVAKVTGGFYPIAAPFVGVLATFLTGNNTNSNVMFGSFQFAVARELGLSGAVMSAAQSVSGGLGCSVASTLVYMAALATKQAENVSVVLKKLIPIVLIIAGIMGIVNYIVINLV